MSDSFRNCAELESVSGAYNSEWPDEEEASRLLHDSPAGTRPAKPSTHDADAEQVIHYAKEAISEVSGYSAQEIEAMRAEAYFLYHEKFCNGWEPVWLIGLYHNNTGHRTGMEQRGKD